jgi:hypothetical protein
MRHLRIVAAAAFSLVLVAPAMAENIGEYGTNSGYYWRHGSASHRMTAQDFDHYDLGIARPTYHSGLGGPYEDGDYPGTIDQNMGPPYLAPRGR